MRQFEIHPAEQDLFAILKNNVFLPKIFFNMEKSLNKLFVKGEAI